MPLKRLMVAIGIGAALLSPQAIAQSFTKPIKIITSTAGSVGDSFARLISVKLGERLGQPVIVDNRSSAGGGRATVIPAVQLPPDGHGYLITPTPSLTLTPLVTKDPGFDTFRDLAPIGLLGSMIMGLGVSGTDPVKSVDELVALAKSKPGQLNYGGFGVSSPQHLAMHSFAQNRSLSMVGVPYKSGTAAMQDLITGRINVMVSAMIQYIPLAPSGKIRVLAVASEKRHPLFPDVPTTRELGITEIDNLWMGMLAPVKTPAEYIARMNREVSAILAMPDVQEALAKQALSVSTGSPAEFGALLKKEGEYWKKLVAAAGVVPE